MSRGFLKENAENTVTKCCLPPHENAVRGGAASFMMEV